MAVLLSFTNSTRENEAKVADVKVDSGGGVNYTADNFTPAGDDSQPLPGDFAVLSPVPGSNRFVVVGYADPKHPQTALAGEKGFYSRDENGDPIASVIAKNDGSFVISNASGVFTLEAGGDIDANGTKLKPGGIVDANSILVDGKELKDHTHNFTNADGIPSITEANN